MLQSIVCGYLGADAQTKNENGKEFTTFRVAHTDRWTDQAGTQHESTIWVDCIMNGRPKVAEWLKAGTLVYVSGHCKLRCYSSEKARGFVAGMTISALVIELLGGQSDVVPRRLYDIQGRMHEVNKYYHTDAPGEVLTNGRDKQFAVDDNGWVLPLEQAQKMMEEENANTPSQDDAQQAGTETTTQLAADANQPADQSATNSSSSKTKASKK